MDRKLLNSIAGEVDIVVRVRKISEAEVTRRLVEFIDCEFHGVVPLPLEAGTRTTNEVK